jgi:hypothetical protein
MIAAGMIVRGIHAFHGKLHREKLAAASKNNVFLDVLTGLFCEYRRSVETRGMKGCHHFGGNNTWHRTRVQRLTRRSPN